MMQACNENIRPIIYLPGHACDIHPKHSHIIRSMSKHRSGWLKGNWRSKDKSCRLSLQVFRRAQAWLSLNTVNFTISLSICLTCPVGQTTLTASKRFLETAFLFDWFTCHVLSHETCSVTMLKTTHPFSSRKYSSYVLIEIYDDKRRQAGKRE